MREIKFRAWNENEKSMYDWDEIQSDWENDGYFETLFRYDHWVPMQFTGLHDKNGKEIYEGDILNYIPNNTRRTLTGAVEYGKKAAGFNLSGYTRYSIPTNCEVIGNIYDNPELLKP